VREIVSLGHRARSAAGLKVRQPLRRLVVQGAGAAAAHTDEIADELRVKDVEFGTVEASELKVKPNLRVLGPKLGPALGELREALAAGRFEELDGGRFRVNGRELEPEEVLVERVGLEGWAVASENGVTVALDTTLDDDLRLEARVNDVIRSVQQLRKESGLEITDRVRLWIADAALLPFAERIAAETLAVAVELGPELRLERV
jgi:isoleucyl-tRNA synthetase